MRTLVVLISFWLFMTPSLYVEEGMDVIIKRCMMDSLSLCQRGGHHECKTKYFCSPKRSNQTPPLRTKTTSTQLTRILVNQLHSNNPENKRPMSLAAVNTEESAAPPFLDATLASSSPTTADMSPGLSTESPPAAAPKSRE
jgi:hypothetical protein